MAEDGIDITGQTSYNVEECSDVPFDFVITDRDNVKGRCSFLHSTAKKFHQNFPDHAKSTGCEDEISLDFRGVRDQIKAYVQQFEADKLVANFYG